jgi:hypothetical protein
MGRYKYSILYIEYIKLKFLKIVYGITKIVSNSMSSHTNCTHKPIDDVPRSTVLYVFGRDAGHPDVIVQTTSGEIEDVLVDLTMERAKSVFPQIWNNIKNVNTDMLYNKRGQEWTDFCNDLILFYCYRTVLFKSPIPVSTTLGSQSPISG